MNNKRNHQNRSKLPVYVNRSTKKFLVDLKYEIYAKTDSNVSLSQLIRDALNLLKENREEIIKKYKGAADDNSRKY
ncbi:hypothetical protein [Methanobacterium sp.]|uniref:hypothetical protein n=1 Tax=Methanobacterium sp. TaxID=2164 RepID=UPI003C76CC8E